MNLYQFELTAICPNGKLQDRYDCAVTSEATIQVERIAAICQRISTQKRFQEDIADELRNELQARVTVVGWHFGVKVTCVRE